MIRLLICIISLLSACATVEKSWPEATRAVAISQTLQPMKRFGTVVSTPPQRSNQDIIQDFLDLSFRMESGRTIPVLTRFDGPITVRVTGRTNPTMMKDLESLLQRLQTEAMINIRIVSRNSPAAITIEAVPKATLQKAVPSAACFVVPRINSWKEFKAARRTSKVDWTTLDRRDRAVIFVPSDVAPQEIRDCMHEELAQALGPLNDLYRLPDSVFNDDNIHTVLTAFDMLILRAYYAQELSNGMTRSAVAARLPAILTRLNAAGDLLGKSPQRDTARDWIDAIQLALSRGESLSSRRAAAQKAVYLADAFGWSGTRAGFANYAYGRLLAGYDPHSALQSFNAARQAYGQNPDTNIHSAHVAVQHAAFSLAAGNAELTISLADAFIPVATRNQNAALLATLMMFKSEALDMRGDTAQAAALRLDSLGWARYGFGSDRNVQARLDEIAALRRF